jgi:hypothetical protein
VRSIAAHLNFKGENMETENENEKQPQEGTPLEIVGGADRIQIIPGLVFEDRIKVKTQRRLEKQFKVPILKLFPGKTKHPITEKIEEWDGIDFTYLDNLVPLLTIFGRQANQDLTETNVEDALDKVDNPNDIIANLNTFFEKVKKRYEKNQNPPNQ